ncbi:MAG: hypothetical protein ACJ71Q_06340 [Terriglobales bacterium]
MKSRYLRYVAQIGLVVLAASLSAVAQNPTHGTFVGVINAYSPQTTTTGPYEVRGPWSLKLEGDSGKADFSAALDMKLSDGWVLTKNSGNFDPNSRDTHTHHVTLVDADVTPNADGNGFQVNGIATITLNGNPAPVSPAPLTINITGGKSVEFSNITMTFGAPASRHFGTAPLSGVVRTFKQGDSEDDESHRDK